MADINTCVESLVSIGLSKEEAIESCEAAVQEVSSEKKSIFNASVKTDEDERYVLGPVLIPNHVDTHGTMFPKSTVRNAAFDFMSKYQRNRLMHMVDLEQGEDVSIVESYVAPTDLEINGKSIKEGTWMMGVKIHNDKLWNHIKEGNIRGFSIGAHVNGTVLVVKGNEEEPNEDS